MRKYRLFFWLLVTGFWLLFSSLSFATVPHLINYQGRLTDTNGQPLEGAYALTFRIYDAETAGNLLWEETQSGIVIQKGLFSVSLGSVTNLNLAFDAPYFLEIKVGNEVMSPRQRITSSGYAIRAEDAEKLGGKLPSDYASAADITSTPTANKVVRLDSNAKLPLSALKVYDSGWFAVAYNTDYVKTHNLGTTKVITQVYFSPNSDGSGNCYLQNGQWDQDQDGRGNFYQIFVNGLSPTTISISTPGVQGAGYNKIAFELSNHDTAVSYDSGYCRIIMLALE